MATEGSGAAAPRTPLRADSTVVTFNAPPFKRLALAVRFIFTGRLVLLGPSQAVFSNLRPSYSDEPRAAPPSAESPEK